MWWVYKCNARGEDYQPAWGDWNEFFANELASEWGSTEWTPKIATACKGDMIIAYQTDRNELVGLAKVVGWRHRRQYQDLMLKPFETIGAKVRPLKRVDPGIAKIPALRPGPIATLYNISSTDAQKLLLAARAAMRVDPAEAASRANGALKGAGFGAPEQNRRVEQAAIKFVTRYFENKRWNVKNFSDQNRGYDLVCSRQGKSLHLEVKGSRGTKHQFIVTANERKVWRSDSKYVLALVTNALSSMPSLSLFRGIGGFQHFQFEPISFVVTVR